MKESRFSGSVNSEICDADRGVSVAPGGDLNPRGHGDISRTPLFFLSRAPFDRKREEKRRTTVDGWDQGLNGIFKATYETTLEVTLS